MNSNIERLNNIKQDISSDKILFFTIHSFSQLSLLQLEIHKSRKSLFIENDHSPLLILTNSRIAAAGWLFEVVFIPIDIESVVTPSETVKTISSIKLFKTPAGIITSGMEDVLSENSTIFDVQEYVNAVPSGSKEKVPSKNIDKLIKGNSQKYDQNSKRFS